MRVLPIDLRHLGLSGAISTYLIQGPEPALVDPGPATTLPRLREGLGEAGVRISDLRHLLLTHIHLDHAGATGHLARENPALRVHVHEEGAAHMARPGRLVASTRRTFGEDHDRYWGEVLAVPGGRLQPWRPGSPRPLPDVEALATPGHISHHLAYLDGESGTLFSGDSMGIILAAGAPTHPPTPPPSLDLASWEKTLRTLRGVEADRVAVAHFGIHEDVGARAEELRDRLAELRDRVRRAMDEGDEGDAERYEEEVRERQGRHVPGDLAERYFTVFKSATDWRGVEFHLEREAG